MLILRGCCLDISHWLALVHLLQAVRRLGVQSDINNRTATGIYVPATNMSITYILHVQIT